MKAIDKIKKLLSLSKSPNENEAAAALAMAMKLCAENNLSIKEVEGTEDSGGIIERRAGKEKTRQEKWEIRLITGLAECLGCRILIENSWSYDKKRFCKTFMVVGTEQDIEIVSHMFVYLRRTLLRLANLRGFSLYQYKNSFLLGGSRRLIERAESFFKGIATDEEKQNYALVLKRGALAQRYVDNIDGVKTLRQRSSQLDRQAYIDGIKAANSVPLSQAVSGGSSPTLALQ